MAAKSDVLLNVRGFLNLGNSKSDGLLKPDGLLNLRGFINSGYIRIWRGFKFGGF